MRYLIVLLTLIFALPAQAQEPAPVPGGDVRIPLADYTALLAQLASQPNRAPADYAIGQSQVSVQVREIDDRKTAVVNVQVQVETFEDEWVLVPLLPPGTALKSAHVDGKPVQLVERPDGWAMSLGSKRTWTWRLRPPKTFTNAMPSTLSSRGRIRSSARSRSASISKSGSSLVMTIQAMARSLATSAALILGRSTSSG